MKINYKSAMAVAAVIAVTLAAFAGTGRAGEPAGGPEKRAESRKGITVLLPDGSPAIANTIMLLVGVNWELGDVETNRPYGTFSIPISKNMLQTVGITRKVGAMELLGPYGPLSTDEQGFLPLPDEVVRAVEKQQSFRNVGNFFPRIVLYDQPSDFIVLKGGGFFTSKDIFYGRPKSVKLTRGRLDEEERREFFAERMQ